MKVVNVDVERVRRKGLRGVAENVKFKLLFEDRIGIVFDVARLMVDQGLNIVSMMVEQQDGFAKISVEIEKTHKEVDKDSLLGLFATLPKFEGQAELPGLPNESKQKWFRTLFDGVSEGVLSVDSKGIVNAANKVACRVLDLPYEELVNTHVSQTNPEDCILLECIEKRMPINRRRAVTTSTGRIEYNGTAQPINDSHGNYLGAILLMKNLKEVGEVPDAELPQQDITFSDFIGQSAMVTELVAFAKKIAKFGSTVSITGESGTGKELLARALHHESGREGPFIPVNCAALPEPLIESELFGYADGAFTGARRRGKPGLFEMAQNGTIFLDEIGEMPVGPQAKLLRVLQDGSVRRIGAYDEAPFNARVITATNKNLSDMVEEGVFREDLYYRVNVLTIQIPPLRDRLDDLPFLVERFLQQFNRKQGRVEQYVSREAMEKLRSYRWPGNVRELQNVIERASILSEGMEIPGHAIILGTDCPGSQGEQSGKTFSGKGLKEIVGHYEMKILLETLNSTPSVRKAAKQLGISHTALLNKMRKYRIDSGNKSFQRLEAEPVKQC